MLRKYREKQAKQQKLSEEEKEIAAKEFFAKKVTYEWNQTVKQGPARKPFYINLKNVENGKDEYCFVVVGDLDNRTFTHVAVSKLNNIHQGSFHILVRHYSQFRHHIHASRLPDLSNRARSLLEKCEQARNHADRNRAYTELENYLESPEGVVDGIVLDELQFSIFHYIRNQMTHSNFVGYIVDDQRRISYHFKIGTKILRVVLSSQIYNEQPQTIRKKFREIITAYFIDPKTVEGKLKMPKLPMKRRRRQYFVDFIV
uniref:Uncharacterized protein n=1 Tax=Panagrolaimus davidi TaxID=227884 RepID=A0A914PRZ3_9BILA